MNSYFYLGLKLGLNGTIKSPHVHGGCPSGWWRITHFSTKTGLFLKQERVRCLLYFSLHFIPQKWISLRCLQGRRLGVSTEQVEDREAHMNGEKIEVEDSKWNSDLQVICAGFVRDLVLDFDIFNPQDHKAKNPQRRRMQSCTRKFDRCLSLCANKGLAKKNAAMLINASHVTFELFKHWPLNFNQVGSIPTTINHLFSFATVHD